MRLLSKLSSFHISLAFVIAISVSWFHYFEEEFLRAFFWILFSVNVLLLYLIVENEKTKSEAIKSLIDQKIRMMEEERNNK
jgi:hypothetical protein